MCQVKGGIRYPCERFRNGAMCSSSTRKTTESPYRGSTSSRDDTPSPINPATPTGTGPYLVRRRPSGAGSRPSTRDGHQEIIIEFGSKNSRGKKYPAISVSTKDYSRSSLGSFGSNEAAVESQGSDASYPIRTGLPEARFPPIDSLGQPRGSIATPAHGYNHNRTPSASSFTSSSQTPSLHFTSEDYDPPVSQRTPRNPTTIVHNYSAPPSPSRRHSGLSPVTYRTSVITPHGVSQETHTLDSLYPRDYAGSTDVSASSYTSSGVPESTRHSRDSDERRRKKDGGRRQQEELDSQANAKQVRFEIDRSNARTQARAENLYAEKEKDRAAAREERHRHKEEERVEKERQERAEKSAREHKKEKSKTPTTEFNPKRPSTSRRMSASMSSAQVAEQRRLLAAEERQLQSEREATEAREREEEAAAYRQQHEPLAYYDPRGGDRSLSSNNNTVTARRNSISRHDSVSGVRSTGLTRTGSKRRTSISQPNPPPGIDTQVPVEPYTTRPASSRTRAPPPLSFPANFNQDLGRPSSSARRASFNQDNPFAAPPIRGSVPTLDHPFSPTTSSATDPWDVRAMQDTLPIPREREGRYNSMQQRGEAVINQSRTYRSAQQATHAMAKAGEYASVFETDSDSLEDSTPMGYASRTGLSGKGRKKY